MDSEPQYDGILLDIIDDGWRADLLPFDRIFVPSDKLPDPEADSNDSHLTLKEQEQKWNDLALTSIAPEFGFIDPISTNSV